MAFFRSYVVHVAYRNAGTQWRWKKSKVVRGMECTPHWRSRWPYTESRTRRLARARSVTMCRYIEEVLGQDPSLYLHPACPPVRRDPFPVGDGPALGSSSSSSES